MPFCDLMLVEVSCYSAITNGLDLFWALFTICVYQIQNPKMPFKLTLKVLSKYTRIKKQYSSFHQQSITGLVGTMLFKWCKTVSSKLNKWWGKKINCIIYFNMFHLELAHIFKRWFLCLHKENKNKEIFYTLK